MTKTTWPFPDRPGVPLNPQQPGKHWLRSPEGELCLSVWFVTDNPKYSFWEKGPGWSSPAAIARTGWTYHGPVLTPEELAAKDAEIARLRAALAAAQVTAFKKAADIARQFAQSEGWSGASALRLRNCIIAEAAVYTKTGGKDE